jgi:MSHA biogenesis protein MshN
MSVINKMLRDLDQRAPSATAADNATAAASIRQGTASVGSGAALTRQAPARRVRYGLAATVVLLLAGLAAALAWWQVQGRAGTAATLAQVPAATAANAASTAVPVISTPLAKASAPMADQAAAVVPVASSTPVPSEHAPLQGKIETARLPISEKAQTPPARVDAPSVAKASTTPATTPNMALRMETALESRNLKEAASAMRAGSAAAPANDRGRPQPANGTAPEQIVSTTTPAQDALAQAQALWNAGSREAAAELLREAVGIAERAGPNGGNAALIPLVRELTRMQLAEGQFGAVWDLLHRLEPHLGNHADLWAIRANAAQRLGRHQDSVHAYMVALQSRPSEQRWLLGSAVSLAALGQTSSAAEMADKARAAGPISKDVQTYLRQMNVPLRD